MITVFGKEIPNKMDELTLDQFQKISGIHNNSEYDSLEKHCKVFEYLGITEDDMDVDFEIFLENVKLFNKDNFTKKDTVEEIELEGYTYKAEMKLSVKESRLIEKIVKQENKDFVSDIIALMFKRTDLTKAEHYDSAHLKYKAKLFGSIPAEIAMPYLTFVTQKITSHADTKPMESDISGAVPGDQEAEQ